MSTTRITKAVIPAAGLGTRMLPIARAVPKEMLPIVDRPAVSYLVEEAVKSGITDILIITGRGKEAIENYFDYSTEYDVKLHSKGKEELVAELHREAESANVHFVRQLETKGLGHAIGRARAFVGNEPFAVLYGDDIIFSEKPVIRQLIDVYEKYGRAVAGVKEVTVEQIQKYSSLKVDPIPGSDTEFYVTDMIEKPAPDQIFSLLTILGRVLLTPDIFDIIDATPPGAGGEIQLTDAMKTLSNTVGMNALIFEGTRYDLGSKLGFLAANVERAVKDPVLGKDFTEYLKNFAATL